MPPLVAAAAHVLGGPSRPPRRALLRLNLGRASHLLRYVRGGSNRPTQTHTTTGTHFGLLFTKLTPPSLPPRRVVLDLDLCSGPPVHELREADVVPEWADRGARDQVDLAGAVGARQDKELALRKTSSKEAGKPNAGLGAAALGKHHRAGKTNAGRGFGVESDKGEQMTQGNGRQGRRGGEKAREAMWRGEEGNKGGTSRAMLEPRRRVVGPAPQRPTEVRTRQVLGLANVEEEVLRGLHKEGGRILARRNLAGNDLGERTSGA